MWLPKPGHPAALPSSSASLSQGFRQLCPIQEAIAIAPVAGVVSQVAQFTMRDSRGVDGIPEQVLVRVLDDRTNSDIAIGGFQSRFGHIAEAERLRLFQESLEQAERVETDDRDPQIRLQVVQLRFQ